MCPVKIDIPELLLYLRAEIKGGGGSRQEQVAGAGGTIKERRGEVLAFSVFAAVMRRPWLYELSVKAGRVFQKVIVRQNRIGKVGKVLAGLAPPLGAWTSARDLRPLAENTFREQWRSSLNREAGGQATLPNHELIEVEDSDCS